MKRLSLISILIIGFVAIAFAAEPLEREVQRSFAVNKDAKLSVSNKYGAIHLSDWEKSEIKIDVIIKVRSNWSRSRVQELFENIRIDMKGTKDFVEASTYIPSYRNTNGMNLNMSIDYYIKAPASVALHILQTYGNVIMNNDWDGATRYEIKYGDLQIRDLKSDKNYIDIAYGDVYAEDVNELMLDLAYGEARVDEIKVADIHSSYSDLELGNIHKLEMRSSFDDVEIDEVVDMDIRANYTDFEVGKLVNNADISMDYGEIEIDHLAAGFKMLEIDSDNADVEISVDKSATFSVDVMTRYGDFDVYDDRKIDREKLSHYSYRYRGTVGSGKAVGEIIVESDYANIEIK